MVRDANEVVIRDKVISSELYFESDLFTWNARLDRSCTLIVSPLSISVANDCSVSTVISGITNRKQTEPAKERDNEDTIKLRVSS